jgi:ankyrin repeat protein
MLSLSLPTRRLWAAVNRRDARGAAAALADGADPNALVGPGGDAKDNLSALHNAMQLCEPALVRAIAEAAARAGTALDWTQPSSLRGYTPLMMPPTLRPAATPAREAETVAAALEAGALASIEDRGATGAVMEDSSDLSYTPLLFFLVWGREHEGGARALLDAGACTAFVRVKKPNVDFGRGDLRVNPLHGSDALMLAVQGSFSSALVAKLLDQGACLGHLNAHQDSALMMALTKTRSREPAVRAAAAGAAATIVKWVRARGAAVDALPWPLCMPPTRTADVFEVPNALGYRALHFAASFGCAALVPALVAAGADREAHCVCGWTPLMVAAGSGQPGAVKALLAAGAYPNNHDGFGVTALHVAIAHGPSTGNLDCLDALLAWPDTDVHAMSITGLTPLALAGHSGNVLTIARLQKRIAEDVASGKCSDAAARERERLAALSVKQLRVELSARDISVAGLPERGEIVEALLAPPSAASQVRMKDQQRDLIEKVSFIGLPASPRVMLWGRLPQRSYREGAVLRAFPDNDLMGSGAMWCRDGRGWRGDEAPFGATAEMAESRRRGPYFQIGGNLRRTGGGGGGGGDGGGGGGDGAVSLGTIVRGDATLSMYRGSADLSGVGDLLFVGFPLRWRIDVLFNLGKRSENVADSLDYVELRGPWNVATLNFGRVQTREREDEDVVEAEAETAAEAAAPPLPSRETEAEADAAEATLAPTPATVPTTAPAPAPAPPSAEAEGEADSPRGRTINIVCTFMETFSHNGEDLGAKAPFLERPSPDGVMPPEVVADFVKKLDYIKQGHAIDKAMDTTAKAAGTAAAPAAAAAGVLTCATCGRVAADAGAALSACSRCKAALYCGRECQRLAWPQHKAVCKAVDAAQRLAGR